MHVFLSWSGQRSKMFAVAFKNLLENVIQGAEVYISTENKKGRPWYTEITDNLKKTDFMVTFLTKENRSAPWINFEAGAIAARKNKNNCSALLIDIKPEGLIGPLVNLNHTKFEKDDIKRLIKHINNENGEDKKIKEHILESAFTKFWDDFEKEINQIPKIIEERKFRTTDEKIEELSIQTENQYHFLKFEIQNATRLLFVNRNLPLIEDSFSSKRIDNISKRFAEVIRLYFGIEREHSLTIEEIGERFGLTQEEVINDLVDGIKQLQKLKQN